jgi:hypothetical protein
VLRPASQPSAVPNFLRCAILLRSKASQSIPALSFAALRLTQAIWSNAAYDFIEGSNTHHNLLMRKLKKSAFS